MSEFILSQVTQKVKPENLCISMLKGRQCLASQLALEILLDESGIAADILAVNGFSAASHDGGVLYADAVDFYGIAEKYIAGVMQRFHISARNTPEYVKKNINNEVILSKKLVLALSALMQQGRNIPVDSKVMQVYNNLSGTRFYERAEARLEELQNKRNEHDRVERAAINLMRSAFNDNSDVVEIGESGRVLISVANLARLIQMYNAPQTESAVPPKVQQSKTSTSPRCKRVMLCGTDGERREFPSVKDCADFLGVKPNSISNVLGRSGKIHGYTVVACRKDV